MPPPPTNHERVFRPRLPWKVRLSMIGLSAFGALCAFMAVVDPTDWPLKLLVAGLFGLLPASAWLVVPQEVVFGDAITIRRRLLADKRIEYRDITGFGLGRLVARKGHLSWRQFDNGSEVEEVMDRLIEAGMIRLGRLDHDVMTKDIAALEAAYITTMVSTVVAIAWAALLFFDLIPAAWYEGYPNWVFRAAIPICVFTVTYLVAFYWRYYWRHRGRAA